MNTDYKTLILIIVMSIAYAYVCHKIDIYVKPTVVYSVNYCRRLLWKKLTRRFK